ncbi:lamin tail domain-containing protein [Candidatus Pacearchaeota archaeon]|nr:lamin tail domain-containing protein [Candidatus Pacearchaeota archaeon]
MSNNYNIPFRKILLFFILTISLVSQISAIIISEIEINPANGKTGKEWVEIYNDENKDIDISGWSLWDGLTSEKKRYTFPENTEIKEGDFYVVEFSNVLNNGGDFVIFKDDNGKIKDKTENLKEESASSKTWQFCNGEWIFDEQTKENDNECKKESNDEESNAGNNVNETNDEEDNNYTGEEIKNINAPKSLSPIKLGAKTIKSEENKELPIKKYAIYGLIGFGILISLLLFFRNKKYKTEFK